MGRPATKQKALRSGFYIAIRTKNSNTVVKIRRDNKHQILPASNN